MRLNIAEFVCYNLYMELITRKEAKNKGLKYYFTGRTCPKGHVCKRKTHNATCYMCSQAARSKRQTIDGGRYRSYHKLRRRVLEKLGNKCKQCDFADVRALQIDHVNGGGCKELKLLSTKNYYMKILRDKRGKYQILCANCNWIKRHSKNENRKGKTRY